MFYPMWFAYDNAHEDTQDPRAIVIKPGLELVFARGDVCIS